MIKNNETLGRQFKPGELAYNERQIYSLKEWHKQNGYNNFPSYRTALNRIKRDLAYIKNYQLFIKKVEATDLYSHLKYKIMKH